MVQNLTLTITLASDAEPGSGIGAVGLNQCLPRGLDGRPILQASHIKGLMLDALRQIIEERSWNADLEAAVFGAPDASPSRAHFADARLTGDIEILTISRTAVGAEGSKLHGSLRKVEALPCGQTLIAPLRLEAEPGDAVDLAVRLAALSVYAVGGDRNRGAGACRVTLSGESRGPGELLKALDKALMQEGGYPSAKSTAPRVAARSLAVADPEFRRVILIADGPICCPERPVAAGNTIESGISIPASAVQGVILTRLNAVDGALASACFEHAQFRAWPLLPVAALSEGATEDVIDKLIDDLPTAVHVSLSHRISKLARADGSFILGDKAIAALPWNETSPGAPLKGCDGVLLVRSAGDPELWPAASIPRVLNTHGVHRDGEGKRNLFSVLSMARMVYSGLVSLPLEAAEALDRALAEDAQVSIGKARSVRGSGRLLLRSVPGTAPLDPVDLPECKLGRVFIVQSPLAIPDDQPVGRAEEALARLVADAGWPEMDLAASQADCGLRFGWNRHGLGQRVNDQQRLRARRCILPGSVVVLKESLPDPAAKLLIGIGPGREAGFGALLPHPGIASTVMDVKPAAQQRHSRGSGQLALTLWTEAGKSDGPSAAQISALRERLARGGQSAARDYLKTQRERPPRVWQRWEHVYKTLTDRVFTSDPAAMTVAVEALRGWQDLAVVHKEERR